jgi:DNA polymerase V
MGFRSRGMIIVWEPETLYKKNGVPLECLENARQLQLIIFVPAEQAERRANLMAHLDKLNQYFGTCTLRFGSAVSPKGSM